MLLTSIFGIFANIIMMCVLEHGHDHDGEDHGHSHGIGEDDHGHSHDHSSHDDHGHSHDHKEAIDKKKTDTIIGHTHEHGNIKKKLLEDNNEGSNTTPEEMRHKNMNLYAAYLHILGDLIQSVGVFLASLLIII